MESNFAIPNAANGQHELQEKLNRVQRELTILYEVSNAMRTTLDLDHILYIILTGVTAHTGLGFNRALLFLINHKQRCLEPQMAIGPESGEHAQKIWQYISTSQQHLDDLIKEEKITVNIRESALLRSIKDLKIPLGGTDKESLLARVYHTGIPLHISLEDITCHADDPLLRVFQTNELVIMPLKAKDTVNGLIIADNFYTQKPITQDDLRIFTMLANQAGLAIENSRLYEMIMHQSHTDPVTHVWNHGFFQNQLGKEIETARKENRSLSLLMLDIDDFKKLNDTHGHQYGDIILKELAGCLKEFSRENDYICRYGGEEFGIILPHTDKQRAYAIAERLRGEIEGHHFSPIPREQSSPLPDIPPKKITVSLGLATFPDDTQTKEELITKADKAMYIAKFGGKNQTCAA